MRSVFVIALLLAFQTAIGDVNPRIATVLKQSNPTELAYYAAVSDDCPITTTNAERIVKDVFTRRQIKPLARPRWIARDLYLSVMVDCLQLANNNPVFNVNVFFGSENGLVPILYDYPYGSLGQGGSDLLEQGVKDSVEKAIADFIEVNFDLGK